MANLRMNLAVARAIGDSLEEDPAVVLIGEDVAGRGGTFKTSEGLLDQFGPERVRDTPISEMGFLGAAVGAATAGMRPIVEIMFFDFIGVALDQLSTEAAKLRYLSGGTLKVPLTVRGSMGAGMGFGAQHSQTLETLLYATPGLKLAVASGSRTAYGLLRAAVRDDNPVVVLEPRNLYATRERFEPGDDAIIPLGVGNHVHQGDDVTIVALGQMVPIARQAAEESKDWSADVIDLQTLIPWDKKLVLESVARTKRLAIVEESHFSGGWGTEIASCVAAELFGELQAPVLRVTCPDVPVPYNRTLESRFLPNAEYVTEQVSALLETGKLPPHWWERQEATMGGTA